MNLNPLHPARLGLLWLLGGIPLERHTAAIRQIDEAHQHQVARLRRQTYVPDLTITVADPLVLTNAAAVSFAAGVGGRLV